MQVDTVKQVEKQVRVEMTSDDDELFTATVTIETKKDGETTSETKSYTGTKQEVDAKIQALDNAGLVPPAPPVADSNTDS
ncbi:MAG: Uncharacterised protein [Flavobacteriaceae bacterium]|nr:MAG: Uncharacterised protein [Flavobacteriaceae bacterium]